MRQKSMCNDTVNRILSIFLTALNTMSMQRPEHSLVPITKSVASVDAVPTLGKSAALRFVLVCVLLDVIGFGLIIPVLPALVKEFTVGMPDAMSSQTLWYGVLMAAYGLAQFVAAPLLGALSDRYGRRPVLLISQVGWGLDFLLIACAGSLPVMLIARLMGGVTGAGFTVASAYVTDVTTPEKRTQGMGMIGAMFGLGFIVGPVVGGFLGDIDLRLPFYVAAGVALLNVAYGWFILPESLTPANRTRYTRAELLSKSNPFKALFGLMRLPRTTQGVFVPALVTAVCLTNLAQFMMHTTFALFTNQRYSWGAKDNGIALFVVGIIYAAIQGGLLGRLIKHLGEKRLAIAAMSVAMVEFIGFAFAINGTQIYLVIVLSFLGSAAMPALMGLVSKTIGGKEQGALMGVFTGLSALMGVVAPLLATPILAASNHFAKHDQSDPRFGTVYVCAAVFQGISVVLVWWALRKPTVVDTAS
jgi:MFS transporter, DHA1 family, tetracycline resistance protein